MKKFPAYVGSCVISNKLIMNCRPCYSTRLWQSRLSRVSGRWRLQRQYDGQLRSHANALQDERREHAGQEEDKMRKELQHALTQESNMCQEQLQQA